VVVLPRVTEALSGFTTCLSKGDGGGDRGRSRAKTRGPQNGETPHRCWHPYPRNPGCVYLRPHGASQQGAGRCTGGPRNGGSGGPGRLETCGAGGAAPCRALCCGDRCDTATLNAHGPRPSASLPRSHTLGHTFLPMEKTFYLSFRCASMDLTSLATPALGCLQCPALPFCMMLHDIRTLFLVVAPHKIGL
jgi:hypothetical protein